MRKIYLSLFLLFSFLSADIKYLYEITEELSKKSELLSEDSKEKLEYIKKQLNSVDTILKSYEKFPKLTGRVVDKAGLLSQDTKTHLENILKQEEDKSSNQIVVVTLKSLKGYEIEDYSYQLGRKWGIGQKDKNNGVLLVISLNDRKLRIEVGYGLEGVLTDKISHEIIEYTIKPYFKAQEYDKGILKGVKKIIQAIQGEYIADKKNTSEIFDTSKPIILTLLFFCLFFISIVFSAFTAKSKKLLYFKLTNSSVMASFVSIFFVNLFSTNLILVLLNFIIVFILNFNSIKKIPRKSANTNLNDYTSSSYNSGNSSWGGSSGGFSGGFSGGGGSFGGGGASGSW